MQRNYWVVRLGEANKYAEECHKRNVIAIGWSELDADLSKYADLDQLEFTKKVGDQLAKLIEDRADKYYQGSARQLYKFAVIMKPGDVVISPANSEGLKYFGIVRGGYEHAPADPELPLARTPFFRHTSQGERFVKVSG